MSRIKKEPVDDDQLLKTPELGDQMKLAEKQVHMWNAPFLPTDRLTPPADCTQNEVIQAVPQQEQYPSAEEEPPVKEEERRLGQKSRRS